MKQEFAVLQKLLHVLDDTSTLYHRVAPKTTSSHLKLVLQWTAKTHQWIADDLAERMTAAGGSPERGGSLLGPLRALQARWLARISPDIELAYATQTLRREDGVLQCFDEAVAGVADGDLRNHLQMQRREIERACMQIECLVSPMGVRVPTEPARQPIRATAHQPEPRTTAQARGHVSA
jgi:uncharacterized protein (TIGR02284 family)